jgi:hypothetical protein
MPSTRTDHATEAHASISKTNPALPADDDVIKQIDVEQPAGGEGLGRQVEIIRRGRWVAARVVVDDDDDPCVVPHCLSEELADPDERRGDVALAYGWVVGSQTCPRSLRRNDIALGGTTER